MQSAETLANLQKFLTLLNSSLHLNEMLTNVARQLVEMFEVEHSGVLFFSEQDVEGRVIAEYPHQGAVALKVPLTDYPLMERLKVERKPLAVLDAQNDPAMGSARPTMRALGIQSIVIIPLVVQDKLVGSLSLDAIREARTFTEAELELCYIIGSQIAVAVDYTRALEAAESSRRQAQTLHEVNRVLGESLDPDEILSLILEQLHKVISADGSSIHLLVEGGVQLVAHRGVYSTYRLRQVIPLDELWGAREIIKHKRPLLLSHTREHDQWKINPGSPIKSWMGLPLSVRGEIAGILNIDGYSPHQFSEEHIQLAQAFAGQAAMAIHNARLYRQAEKRAELLTSVQEIGLGIAVSLDLKEVLRAVADAVLTLLEAQQARIYLYDAPTDAFTLATTLDGADPAEIKGMQPRRDGLTATVARSGRYVAVPNVLEHPLFQSEDAAHGFKAIIGAPLKKGDEVLGVLNVFYDQPHYFTSDELDLLHLLATQAAVALENARLYELEVKQVEQELIIARQIQQGFFPEKIPQLPGWEIAAVCLPARETGGDFYEFVEREDGALGLVVGDVSGKSIQAAMLMAAAQSLVSAKGSDHHSPARVITETNRLLYKDVPEGAFVAAAYALLAADGPIVSLSNGGQLAPLLVPAGSEPIRLIETPGDHLPLGIIAATAYEELSFALAAGDLLVFYTDGLVERMDSARQLFGFERLMTTLEHLRGQSAEAALQALLQAADTFANGVGPADDMTLVVVRRVNEFESNDE
ncbi:MAG: GAF domain-containing protein [Anaerolineae bacterium]|nr:GAF domain-containing protein [Anaerolineae bacterium]